MIGFVPPNMPITVELLSRKVEEARRVGADVFAFPCEVEGYALWPTQILPPAANAAIPDVLGTLLQVAHENGLKVLGHRMAVHCQSGFWMSQPDWLQRKPDGELIESLPGGGPWPAMCLNSPFGDCLLAQAEEVVSRYPVDGIYFDGLYQRFTGCHARRAPAARSGHDALRAPAEGSDCGRPVSPCDPELLHRHEGTDHETILPPLACLDAISIIVR
jgi:hypothetical protein